MSKPGAHAEVIPPERGHRTRRARPLLAASFGLQRLADAVVIWFTFQPQAAAALFRGIAIGSLVWTTALLIIVWRRQRWARYVLTSFNWGYIVLFGFWALQQWSDFQLSFTDPHLALILGPILYLAANLILIRSRRVRHYANL